jgi:hypothetical protein
MALRHQLMVLRRQVRGRVRLTDALEIPIPGRPAAPRIHGELLKLATIGCS